VGNRIELPAEEVVPPGPYRRLLVELHQLYKAAGHPALRTLSAQIRADNDLPVTVSHEAIRQILRGVGGIPRWPTLKSLTWVLARHARPHHSPDAEVERFLHLWEAAGEISSIPAAAPAIANRSLPYTPEAVHSRLVSILADALDAISTEVIPQSVRAFARYAPDKYATLSTAVLLSWLRDHRDFRAAVVDWCRERRPDAINITGADSASAAAAALLLDEDAAHYYLAVTMRQGPSPYPQSAAGPADLETLLKPASVHLIVEGDEVYSELSAEDKMDKLIHGLATVAERTDAEVTIVFDGQQERPKPIAVPRDLRILYSAPDQHVDELIMTLVRTRHPSRPVVVVTANADMINANDRPRASYVLPSALATWLEEC
jgi:YacP-like NYN domain-containing protein